MILWMYYRQIGKKGWRLIVSIPIKDMASAKAIATMLKEQLRGSELPYEFSVREDGAAKHTKI